MPLIEKICRKYLASWMRGKIISSADFVPRIIQMMDGGLGSQMWQYAVGRGAGIRSGIPVLYDLSYYRKRRYDGTGRFNRSFEIERTFGLDIPRAPRPLVSLYRKYFYHLNWEDRYFVFQEDVQASSEARYLDGYYACADYVDWQGDELRDVFSFKIDLSEENNMTLDHIKRTPNAAAIHMRRGDYVGTDLEITTPAYFLNAIRMIESELSDPKFFVFSNDIEWGKSVLHDHDADIEYVENNDNDAGPSDMMLMSECSHFIISNSSFSWWPAWLSRRAAHKIVIMPDRWHALEPSQAKDAMRADGWRVCGCA